MSSIPNYVRPQDTITLVKEFVVNGEAPRKLPVVIGVQYDLFRYGQEDLPAVPYTTGASFELRKLVSGISTALPNTHVVDEASVEVYGENLIALAAELTTGGSAFRLVDIARPSQIRIKGSSNLKGSSLLAALNGREVAIGDPVLVDDGVGVSTKMQRKVTGFLGRIVAAHTGVNTGKDDGLYAAGLYNPVSAAASNTTVSETFAVPGGVGTRLAFSGVAFGRSGTARALGAINAGEFAEVYTIRVLGAPTGTGIVAVSITSASGKFDVPTVNTTNSSGAYVLNNAALNGVIVTINSTVTPQLGDVFVVRLVGDYDRTDKGWFSVNGTYTGTVDTSVVVTVITGGEVDTATSHVIRIHDSEGLFEPVEVTGAISALTNLATFGGLTIRVQAADLASFNYGLRTGDTFYTHLVAAAESTTDFNGVTLDGPAVDTSLFTSASTDIPVVQLGVFASGLIDENWSTGTPWTYDADTNEVTLGTLSVDNGEDHANPLISGYGSVFGSFRAAVAPGVNASLVTASNTTDLARVGANDNDNDLGAAVNAAFLGSQGFQVGYLRLASYEPAAIAAALRTIEATDSVYALNSLGTTSASRLQLLQHVEAMSVPTKKNFRKVYVGIDSPGRYAVLERQSNNQTYSASVGSYSGGYTLVTLLQDVDLIALNVRAGDEVVFPIDAFTTTVVEVLSATELVIADGLNAAISPPGVPVEIWKPDTPENTIDYLIAAAAELSSFRAVLVWCEGGYRGTIPVPSRYIASEIAGLRSATAPQIGITQVELRTVTSAAPMYIRYTQEQLDTVAAAGVFVVTQEEQAGPVFIRHQLSTETAAGILAWEDSVGMNHDFLAFGHKSIIAKYRTRRNRTEDTRRELEDDLYQYSLDSTKSDLGDPDGPQTTSFRDRAGVLGKVTVENDPDFADRFRYFVDYGVPVPLNGINGTVRIHLDDSGI